MASFLFSLLFRGYQIIQNLAKKKKILGGLLSRGDIPNTRSHIAVGSLFVEQDQDDDVF